MTREELCAIVAAIVYAGRMQPTGPNSCRRPRSRAASDCASKAREIIRAAEHASWEPPGSTKAKL